LNTALRNLGGIAAAGLVAYACASSGAVDDPPVSSNADAGVADAAPSPDAGGCGKAWQPCCDAGCFDDGSFCSINDRCMASHPTDIGAVCTNGSTCQSGLCSYLQDLDASAGAAVSPATVCSEPCAAGTDCSPGWMCQHGPIVTPAAGAGTCVCAPSPETCDGKDNDCDGVVDNDPAASAACTTALGFPSKCIDAGCECAQQCDGGCVNVTNDPNNCGACGKTCTPGLQVCSGSECVCGATVCPIPDGGSGDAGYLVPDGGPGGSPALCVNTQSDKNNCGACGVVCAYTCASGCVPMVLAPIPQDADAASDGTVGPAAVASNGSDVFIVTTANGGVLERCGVTGCNQSPVTIASGLDNTNNTGASGLLALGGGLAYWPGQTAVKDVTTAASMAPSTVSVFAQPANASVFAVTTNATAVLWSDIKLGISSCALGATCASPTVLVAMASLAAAPQVLAADATYVYWMDLNGSVFSAPLAGGVPVTLEPSIDSGAGGPSGTPIAIVASAGRVYYVDYTTGQLMTASGGVASSAVVYSTAQASTLATDGTALYWGNGTNISRCALGASCSAPTWIYGTNATSLAVDATNIYWVDNGSGSAGPRVWEYHK
jgi:hypothetical protein